MRILCLSNYYPPASRGGYEQWCQEVSDGLRGRGHAVEVLTSDYRRNALHTPDAAWVHRSLHVEMEHAPLTNVVQFFFRRKEREQDNAKCVLECVERFKPDVVLAWGMWNVHCSIPALIEKQMPGRVVYYMGDYWPTLPSQWADYWDAPPRSVFTAFPKRVLRPLARAILAREQRPALELEHTLFPSAFMQNEFRTLGIVPPHTKLVYGAIDTSLYSVDRRKRGTGFSLLYIGRLSPEKGVHTAVQAVGYLVRERGLREVTLTIVGEGEPEYEASLRRRVMQERVAGIVTFVPPQPKEAVPALYQQADVLLFTSTWPEPFGRVIVEAMASGVVVIGAAVGGATEIMQENENALVFDPGDAISLARQMERVIESPALRERLARVGRETAVSRFDIQRMTTEIETYLQSLVEV